MPSTRLAGLFLVALLPACGAAAGVPADAGVSASGVSFSREIFPIVQAAGCGSAACHSDKQRPTTHFTDYTTPATTYDGWLNGASFNHCPADGSDGGISVPPLGRGRVVPGDPDASFLVQKLREPREMCGAFYGRMPPAPRPRLAPADIELIRRWILEGARDN
jgi:hypothetical protein